MIMRLETVIYKVPYKVFSCNASSSLTMSFAVSYQPPLCNACIKEKLLGLVQLTEETDRRADRWTLTSKEGSACTRLKLHFCISKSRQSHYFRTHCIFFPRTRGLSPSLTHSHTIFTLIVYATQSFLLSGISEVMPTVHNALICCIAKSHFADGPNGSDGDCNSTQRLAKFHIVSHQLR